jgi:hypothetical protein
MKSDAKQNEIAASPEQILPGKTLTGGKRVFNHVNENSVEVPSIQSGTTVAMKEAGNASGTASAQTPVETGTTHSRLQQLILGEVTVMRHFQPDKMEVVLRPDSQTRISLQLHLRGDQVDATARCDEGNYTLLNTHWGDLQRDMERGGVHLAPLRDSQYGFGSGGSSQNFSQSNPQQNDRQTSAVSVMDVQTEAEDESRSPLESAVLGTLTNKNLLTTWA